MHFLSTVSLALAFASAGSLAAPAKSKKPTKNVLNFPTSSEPTIVMKQAFTIAAGQTYDGKMRRIDRGQTCTGQKEGGNADAVFILSEGATLKNVIIGANQREGVHCLGSCTINNVWWEDVCEDALTFKGDGNGFVSGGGARNAEDKIIQHNGLGRVMISNFQAENFGKLYRSCGSCKRQGQREVVMDGITAHKGKVLAGINSNFKDTATMANLRLTDDISVCTRFKAVTKGEPTKIGSGVGDGCRFTPSRVTSLPN
ncbi:hypothetical protein HDU86_000121 [Geranomyces michiganensis]|nr:hypothetical protein HDU86_000121 [Geranomyces michiganensis]